MAQGSLDDLRAFLSVARERRFIRAAAQLGVYCPSRPQPTPAFALLVEALRHRG